jgi:hypothetical protein
MLDRLPDILKNQTYKIAIVLAGTNDLASKEPKSIFENLQKIYSAIEKHGALLTILTVPEIANVRQQKDSIGHESKVDVRVRERARREAVCTCVCECGSEHICISLFLPHCTVSSHAVAARMASEKSIGIEPHDQVRLSLSLSLLLLSLSN